MYLDKGTRINTLRSRNAKLEKVRELFEELLKHNILELPEVKCPNEVGQTDNLKYCPTIG